MLSFLANYSQPQTILADPDSVNYAVYSTLESNAAFTVKALPDPLLPMKGTKNETELAHTRECHIRDAVAMVRFQKELEERLEAGETLTELTVDEISTSTAAPRTSSWWRASTPSPPTAPTPP